MKYTNYIKLLVITLIIGIVQGFYYTGTNSMSFSFFYLDNLNLDNVQYLIAQLMYIPIFIFSTTALFSDDFEKLGILFYVRKSILYIYLRFFKSILFVSTILVLTHILSFFITCSLLKQEFMLIDFSYFLKTLLIYILYMSVLCMLTNTLFFIFKSTIVSIIVITLVIINSIILSINGQINYLLTYHIYLNWTNIVSAVLLFIITSYIFYYSFKKGDII